MPIDTYTITDAQADQILQYEEGHYGDLKSIDIRPARLTESASAFANADGGELYIGIDEDRITNARTWRGFSNQEAANSHLQVFERFFPLGRDFQYSFLTSRYYPGMLLPRNCHSRVP